MADLYLAKTLFKFSALPLTGLVAYGIREVLLLSSGALNLASEQILSAAKEIHEQAEANKQGKPNAKISKDSQQNSSISNENKPTTPTGSKNSQSNPSTPQKQTKSQDTASKTTSQGSVGAGGEKGKQNKTSEKYNEKLDSKKWGIGTPAIRAQAAKAEEIMDKLEDYTVKLSAPCAESGTGWFLDFLPGYDPDDYPTTWYIGSNAHVIGEFSLHDNYRYKDVVLKVAKRRECFDSRTQRSVLSIGRRWSKDLYEGKKRTRNDDEDGEIWHTSEAINRNKSTLVKEVTYDKLDKESSDPQYVYTTTKFATHFYMGIRYLEESKEKEYKIDDNYFKDFSVIEVNFNSEAEARLITNNIYDKYYNTKKRGNKRPLNFLSDLYSKAPEANLKDKPLFTLGYPGNGWSPNIPFGNYSWKHQFGSRVWDWGVSYQVSSTGVTRFEGIRFRNWGYKYSLQNSFGGYGASGSLTVDIDGNVVGLVSHGGSTFNLVEPIRGEERKAKDGTDEYISPKFDLIKGVEGQARSYKSELEYIWRPTWLAKEEKWSKALTRGAIHTSSST